MKQYLIKLKNFFYRAVNLKASHWLVFFISSLILIYLYNYLYLWSIDSYNKKVKTWGSGRYVDTLITYEMITYKIRFFSTYYFRQNSCESLIADFSLSPEHMDNLNKYIKECTQLGLVLNSLWDLEPILNKILIETEANDYSFYDLNTLTDYHKLIN